MTGGWGIVFWIVVAAVLVVVEMATVQLVCIWFSIGALFATLACFVDAAFWLQLLIFLVSSIAVLIVGRPLLLDRLTPKRQATNADRVIGQLGVVKEEINNLNQTGRVNANGLDWTARSAYGEVIPPGTTVLVLQIDGVKLIVQTLPPEPPAPQPQPADPYRTPADHPQPEPPRTAAPGQPAPPGPMPALFYESEPLQEGEPAEPCQTQPPQG